MSKKQKNVVEYRVYDLPIHFPVLLLDGDEWRISDVLSNRLHFHNCLEIGICHTDSGILVFEGERLSYRAGDVTYIPRHLVHTTCSTRGERSRWSYLFVDLEKLLDDMLPETSSSKKRSTPSLPQTYHLMGKEQNPRMHFLVTTIIEEIKACRSNYEAVVKSLFHVLYIEMLRLEAATRGVRDEQPKNTFVLKPALEYIREHYAQPITMNALAEMCHLSETHFRRQFVSIMGTSPLNFLNATRISQACALLITSDMPILAIAEEVGFVSISSFNRCFLQTMGVSPKVYRNPAVHEKTAPHRKYVLEYKGWMTPEEQPEFVDEGSRS